MCAGHALRAGLGKSRAVWHSKQTASNNAMRAMHGRPEGFEHKKASAALHALRMRPGLGIRATAGAGRGA